MTKWRTECRMLNVECRREFKAPYQASVLEIFPALFFSAVLMLLTKMAISSLHSPTRESLHGGLSFNIRHSVFNIRHCILPSIFDIRCSIFDICTEGSRLAPRRLLGMLRRKSAATD
jgi:hypothetical protein